MLRLLMKFQDAFQLPEKGSLARKWISFSRSVAQLEISFLFGENRAILFDTVETRPTAKGKPDKQTAPTLLLFLHLQSSPSRTVFVASPQEDQISQLTCLMTITASIRPA